MLFGVLRRRDWICIVGDNMDEHEETRAMVCEQLSEVCEMLADYAQQRGELNAAQQLKKKVDQFKGMAETFRGE